MITHFPASIYHVTQHTWCQQKSRDSQHSTFTTVVPFKVVSCGFLKCVQQLHNYTKAFHKQQFLKFNMCILQFCLNNNDVTKHPSLQMPSWVMGQERSHIELNHVSWKDVEWQSFCFLSEIYAQKKHSQQCKARIMQQSDTVQTVFQNVLNWPTLASS